MRRRSAVTRDFPCQCPRHAALEFRNLHYPIISNCLWFFNGMFATQRSVYRNGLPLAPLAPLRNRNGAACPIAQINVSQRELVRDVTWFELAPLSP